MIPVTTYPEVIFIYQNGSRVITTNGEEVFEVHQLTPETKLTEGVGYAYGETIYRFMGKPNKIEDPPGLYMGKKKELLLKPYETEEDFEKFSLRNVRIYDPAAIFKELRTNPETFVDNETAMAINRNVSTFREPIRESDDFLKVALKKAIHGKQINISNYRSGFGNPYDFNNLIGIIRRDTKVSPIKFLDWCAVLGLNWSLELTDSGQDRIAPLPEPIVITSENYGTILKEESGLANMQDASDVLVLDEDEYEIIETGEF